MAQASVSASSSQDGVTAGGVISALPHHAEHRHSGHGHSHGGHSHAHGTIDPEIATSERGLWAVKWSLVGLVITAIAQAIVFGLSGSVALLADLIHNVGDAMTALPLGVAFFMGRRQPTQRFAYGFGRLEDLAGVAIVAIVLMSALVTAYESILRFYQPQPLHHLGALAVAAVIGFVGNEAVATFRMRVGREINSAALIADGQHARADGLVSLAVLVSAAGVALGYGWADPAIGLVITLVLLRIVWQSGQTIFTRLLDGVEPEVLESVRHAASHVSDVQGVAAVRARWLGHRLYVEMDVALPATLSIQAAEVVTTAVQAEIMAQMPYVGWAVVRGVSHSVSHLESFPVDATVPLTQDA